MVLDHLDNAAMYFGLGGGIPAALRYLRETDLTRVPTGQHELDGTRLFVRVNEYNTTYPHLTFWEAHRKYIDVQYVQRGVELMGYAPLSRMSVSPYDEELDYVRCDGAGDFFRCESGYFAIFGPQDAHMPGLTVAGPSAVRKFVFKVAVG